MNRIAIAFVIAVISIGSLCAVENQYRHEHYADMLALCSLHAAGLHGWEGELQKSLARKEHCEARAAKDFETRRLF